MQIINGHLVVRFYSGGFWLVDNRYVYDDIMALADGLGISVSALEEVLYG